MEDEIFVTFAGLLPPPYKILLTLQLGLALWYILVSYFYRSKFINVLQLLNLSYTAHSYSSLDSIDHNAAAHLGEFHTTLPVDIKENGQLLAGIRTTIKQTLIPNVVSFTFIKFLQLTFISKENTHFVAMLIYKIVPLLTIAYNLIKLFGYDSSFHSYGQQRMYTSVKRIMVGGINSATMRTNDILLSDSLTSFSKILNDLALFIWTTFAAKSYSVTLEFFVLIIPGLIRKKQCWYEYKSTNQRQHFFNMLKYNTGIYPLLIALIIKINLQHADAAKDDEILQLPISEHVRTLNFFWYLASFVNSTYSFIWDVRMDWGFQLFEPLFNRNARFQILRPSSTLVFKNFYIYYAVILIDFVLRYIWVFKIFVIKDSIENFNKFNHLGQFLFGNDIFSFGYFILELLEILRRWMWCFFKLESDWVKLQQTDSIELDNINRKD